VALLAEHGDDAKVLAGGQSLVPLMALRMSRPGHLVDIGRIVGADRIDVGEDGAVTIGALVRHEQALRSPLIAEHAPLVAAALPHVAHRAIRSRGTVVGSVAHADPAAEMPAVALATGATMIARSATGERAIAAEDFFVGYLESALEPDELLVEMRLPPWPADAAATVFEVARRHGDYALVGVAAKVVTEGDTVVDAALAYFGIGARPVRVPAVEQRLVGRALDPDTVAAAAAIATAELAPGGDIHGSSDYRRHLAGVVTRKALA